MTATTQAILPPAWLGIIGGGQLGMMLAQVARQFGYNVAVLEPDALCPAASYANRHFINAYDDKSALAELAQLCAVITTEFENVPAQSLEYMANYTRVYPPAAAVKIAQNRLSEKNLFIHSGLKTAPFVPISSAEDCHQIDDNFFPAILKTATLGYDGKGQRSVNNRQELLAAFQELNHPECILEQKVALAAEVSLIIARNDHGISSYPLIENHHHNGILATSIIPARVSQELHELALQQGCKLIQALDYTGLLTIEFFITADNQLLVNEIAPRPHNSGHITIEAAETSQFEQQLRAVCGLPLGSGRIKEAGVMLNLLGDVWLNPALNPQQIMLNLPSAKFHWYGKSAAKPGRKMGHVCITASEVEEIIAQIDELSQWLSK